VDVLERLFGGCDNESEPSVHVVSL
jgi:hypothetical protein